MTEQTPPADPADETDPVTVADKPREPTEYEKRLRRENATARTKLRDAEAKAASDLAAAQALADQRLTEAAQASTARIIRAELKVAATSAGMIDVDGLKLLDLSGVTLDDNGDVKIPDGFFDAAKAVKPYLFGAAKTGSTAPVPANTPPVAKPATQMTNEEYRAARAAAVKR